MAYNSYKVPAGVARAIGNIVSEDLYDIDARWSNPPSYALRAIRYIVTFDEALQYADYVTAEALVKLANSVRSLEAYMTEINRGYHGYPVNSETAYYFRLYRGYLNTIKNFLRRCIKAVDGTRSKSKTRTKQSTYRSSKNKRPAARRKSSFR